MHCVFCLFAALAHELSHIQSNSLKQRGAVLILCFVAHIVFFKVLSRCFFLPMKINYYAQNVEIWRRNVEYHNLISACDVRSHVSHENVKMPFVGKCQQNQS